MKVVTPADIINDVIIDASVDSSDASLVEYDAAKADYALGDVVKVAADRKKYKLASDTVAAGTTPKDNPDIWKASPLVEYAAFNYNNEYASTFTGDYKFIIPNAIGMDTLFFQDVDGDTITVELLDENDNVLETQTEDIYDWTIETFGAYLFPEDPVLKRKAQFDFIHFSLRKLRVTISGTTTKCRYVVAGYKDDLGMTLQDGISYSQNNYFSLSRDAWGNVVNNVQRVIEDVSLPVLDRNTEVNNNANKTARLFASPHLFIADDRDKANVKFKFINIFGMIVSNNIVPGASASDKTLKIEGI